MARVLYLAICYSVLKRDCPSWHYSVLKRDCPSWRIPLGAPFGASERKEAPAAMAGASFYMT